MIDHRWFMSRYLLSARSHGWDIRVSLHYALERNTKDLIRRFA